VYYESHELVVRPLTSGVVVLVSTFTIVDTHTDAHRPRTHLTTLHSMHLAYYLEQKAGARTWNYFTVSLDPWHSLASDTECVFPLYRPPSSEPVGSP
jgi:hypothetical protein